MAVTITQGKTHTRFCRLLVSGANLSGLSRQLNAIGLSFSEADATGWEDLTNYLHGRAALSFGPYNAMLSNTAAATGPTQPGTHPTLNATGAPIATAVIGIQEAPTIGAPAFSAYTQQMNYIVSPALDDIVMISADFTQKAGEGLEAVGWGSALEVGGGVSATTTRGSVDNGASTSAGAYGILHVTQSAAAMGTNDWEIKIQDSADDSAWSDLITFTANGSSITAEWQAAAGTVDRYTRAVMTKTAGNDLICWINLIRRR